MRINHNIPALRALHQLSRSNSSLDKTLERLSSGLRINHAADDAAGLAISQKMDTQVRGLKQASRNSMDGISLIQTAEGALNEVHSMLQRMRELAVQVSNGTYDSKDRAAVQLEVDQLQDEILRISETTEFNGMKLLNGNIDRRAFSSYENIADVLTMSDTVEAGTYEFDVTSAAAKTSATGTAVSGIFDGSGKSLISGTLNINGEQIDIEIGQTSEEVFAAIRELCNTVDISVNYIPVSPSDPFGNGSQLTFEMNQYGDEDIVITGSTTLINALGLDSADPSYIYNLGQDVQVDTTSLTNFPPGTTVSTSGNDIIFTGNNAFELKLTSGSAVGNVEITILETGPLDLQIGANENQNMEIRVQNLSPEALGITNINLATAEGAQEAITTIDNAINIISSVRSKLGAYQNRLEHTISNLEVASENMTESLSRILDADMAEEMANYTQQNVISQAGISMLAQANQRPQSILQLLQN